MRELFQREILAFPALKRHHAKRGASAKAEVRENAKYAADSILRSNFAGGRIRKTEANFLKSFLGLFSAPQDGAGGMRAEILEVFWWGRLKIQKQKIQKLSLSFISLCIIPV